MVVVAVGRSALFFMSCVHLKGQAFPVLPLVWCHEGGEGHRCGILLTAVVSATDVECGTVAGMTGPGTGMLVTLDCARHVTWQQ